MRYQPLLLFAALFFAACAPTTSTERTNEAVSEATNETTSDASVTSDEPPCPPSVEVCNGKDDDCDGQIDNAPACGNVADHPCRLGGAFNEGECFEAETCRWTPDEVFVCIPIPQQDLARWHTLRAVLETCKDKDDGKRMFWRGEWYVCDLCNGGRRWRKEKGPRCAKGSVLEWTP